MDYHQLHLRLSPIPNAPITVASMILQLPIPEAIKITAPIKHIKCGSFTNTTRHKAHKGVIHVQL